MKSVIVRSLLLWLWWSSTAAAQGNTVSVSKSCYISGEAFVVSFTDPNRKVGDWIGIIKSTNTGNSVLQYVFTCGTFDCNATAPASGTISIFNSLPAGLYAAVLLRSDTFNVLAKSANFTIAATCPAVGGPTPTSNTVSVGKSCYIEGEGVLASFTEVNPQVGDKVGLIQASADVNGASVAYPAVIRTCGSFGCSFAPARGSVSLFPRLPTGQYKAVLLKGDRLIPLALSSNFNIAKTCGGFVPPPPPTRPSTPAPVRPTPPVARSSISVSRSCYKPKQFIVATFVDIGAQPGDRVGLVNASFDVNANRKSYPSVIFTCGTFNCTTAPTSGTVNVFQNFSPGKYKAVLLRGPQLIALAVSANFTIATTCPGPPFTPTPGHSVTVSKSCYRSAEAVIATFSDSDAQSGDRIGLIEASVDVELPTGYPSVIFTCGTFNCTNAPKSGMVSVFQRFAVGRYKAVLLRGKGLTALAVSPIFNVSNTCN